MTRRRKDDNQTKIVRILRAMGASVAITSNIGNGFPDIVVGIVGYNYLIEIKDGSKTPSKRRFTKKQVDFHREWGGQICVIESVGEAVDLMVKALKREPPN